MVVTEPAIVVKRIFEPAAEDDGTRILVDGIWPRGVSKDAAALHAWRKDVAPSHELRQWFGHRVERWDDFCDRYRAELATNAGVDELAMVARTGRLTLLFSARDQEHNQAVALAEVVAERLATD